MELLNKQIQLQDVELSVDGQPGTFRGYASKFNGIDAYGDTILPGAYDKVVAEGGTVPVFFNHDSFDLPIGKYTKLSANSQGLYVEGLLTLDIPRARDVYNALKAGTVTGLSVGIGIAEDDWEPNVETGGKTIKNVSLLREISICTFPADDRARVSLVKAEDIDAMDTIRDIEKCLRDAGFSKSQALAFIAKAKDIFSSESLRDAEKQNEQRFLAALQRIQEKL